MRWHDGGGECNTSSTNRARLPACDRYRCVGWAGQHARQMASLLAALPCTTDMDFEPRMPVACATQHA